MISTLLVGAAMLALLATDRSTASLVADAHAISLARELVVRSAEEFIATRCAITTPETRAAAPRLTIVSASQQFGTLNTRALAATVMFSPFSARTPSALSASAARSCR